MPITISANKVRKSEPVPAGTHHAICYGVVYLGTLPSFNPQYKPQEKIILVFEMPHERITIKDKDLPRGISKRYTFSFNEKSNLRKDLQSWRGRPFTQAELDSFDIDKVIGHNCFITVLHNEKNGVTYSDIGGISALAKGIRPLPPENPSLYFNINESIASAEAAGLKDIKWPEGLPPWIQKVCCESFEYKAFTTGSPNAEPPDAPAEEDLQPAEDVPF